MRVKVRLFAVAKQLAGRDTVDLELPEGAGIRRLREALQAEVPQLSHAADRMMFAVGTQYADDSTVLTDGTEIACIPPVSGG